MNVSAARLRQRSVYQLANELYELYQQQFDALEQGRAQVELKQYLERRSRIHQLQSELKGKVSRPS
jgi:hypothetical protein